MENSRALGGEISSPRLLHLFSAFTYISADLSSEWFPCLDNPSLGITYPNFAGVSEFKPRSGGETAGWPAIFRMVSNVYILDLSIHTIFIWIFLFHFPSVILLSPWLCVRVALKAEETQHLAKFSFEVEGEAVLKNSFRNRLSLIQHLQVEPDLKMQGILI